MFVCIINYPILCFTNQNLQKENLLQFNFNLFFKQPPFIIKDSDSSRGYKGYCIDLINEIAKKVGFDYEIKEVEDGKFGSLNEKVRMSNELGDQPYNNVFL